MSFRTCLIGHTGFVGSNLARQYSFTDHFRSINIGQIAEKSYDLLVCSGVSAEKWKANRAPDIDRAAIDRLLASLDTVTAAKAVLISTVDVYPVTRQVDETFRCVEGENHAYGTNRLYAESWFESHFQNVSIVRLPGLFGPGLKKNVLFDLLHDNCLDSINPESVFQYYDVTKLWNDIETINRLNLKLVNLVTQPISTRTILNRYFHEKHVGEKPAQQVCYDIRTRHAQVLGGRDYYRFSAAEVLAHLDCFVDSALRGAAA